MANTARLVIDPITRKISTKYEKIRLVKNDNNSMRITFEMPRYVRGHDMSNCSTAEVHYDNISIDRKQKHSDVYVVTDIVVAPEDDQTINFSWLVSRAATQIVGNVDFSLHFGCNEDPSLEYAWHTTTYSGIVVLEGKHNTQSVVEKHPDLVASILDYVDKKISEFDAVDIAQETGESTEAVMSQKATTDALSGKVDRQPVASGTYLYRETKDGSGILKTSATNYIGQVATYGGETSGTTDAGGHIATAMPKNPYHAAPMKYVDDGLVGKLDIRTDKGKWVYTTEEGVQAIRRVGTNPAAWNIPWFDGEGKLKTNAPVEDLDAANKKFVEDGLAGKFSLPKTLKPWAILGTGNINAETGEYTPNWYTRNPVGSGNTFVATFTSVTDASVWDKDAYQDPRFTLGGADPIYPIQYANKRFVEGITTPLADEIALIWGTLGGSIEYTTVESTVNPVTVPSNVFSAANIDKIGTGIKIEVINEAVPSTSEPTYAPNGVTASYDAETGLYTLSSGGEVASPTTFAMKSPISVVEGEKIFVSVEVVSGSVESNDVGTMNDYIVLGALGCAVELKFGDKFAIFERVSNSDDLLDEISLNIAGTPIKFNDFTFRLHIGKQKQTYGVPVASVKKGEETIYTVPEEIRALTHGERPDGGDLRPVYGLAMSDTVYNYLDLEKKQYVVKCHENYTNEIEETNATIDVSAYLTDEDGEITVAAGDKILFVDADGNSAGSTVPSTITYAVKKGG